MRPLALFALLAGCGGFSGFGESSAPPPTIIFAAVLNEDMPPTLTVSIDHDAGLFSPLVPCDSNVVIDDHVEVCTGGTCSALGPLTEGCTARSFSSEVDLGSPLQLMWTTQTTGQEAMSATIDVPVPTDFAPVADGTTFAPTDTIDITWTAEPNASASWAFDSECALDSQSTIGGLGADDVGLFAIPATRLMPSQTSTACNVDVAIVRSVSNYVSTPSANLSATAELSHDVTFTIE